MNQIAQSFSLRIILSFTLSVSLLLLPSVSIVSSDAAQESSAARKGRPRWTRPDGAFPDLEDVKRESSVRREPAMPIPSTKRSKKNEGKPWDGRRVGEPFGQIAVNRAERSRPIRRSHARSLVAQPTFYESQFIDNFFSVALLRSATSEESLYWIYLLRAGHSQGGTSLKLAAIELGRTLFESGSYVAREREPHWYVQDLYRTYLMREPDSGGWAMWENLVSSHGREYVRRGFEESAEFATLMASLAPSGGPGAAPSSLISARVDPANQPGNGMLTRDASWSVPLLSLPGRNGLNLGLTLSYSSMVWTRSGPYFYFDEDNGSPSPGFRLGFPTVQRKAFDAQTSRNSYLMLTPSGHRVDLRQVGSSAVYEAADSSYLQLTENVGHLLVRSTDGTQLKFVETNNEFRCTQVKDRNGNYLTVNYNSLGQIDTVTDTLTRVITFNYDINHNLLSITQAWQGQPQHQWVSFGWSSRNMQHGFAGDRVIGTKNGEAVPVITQVTLNDTSHFTFEYSNSLQVSAIRNYFGTLERNATTFIYQAATGDVPRLTSSSASARNWSGYNNVPSQVTTQYSVDGDGACVLTAPDGVVYKTYYGTGWQKGLVTQTKVEVGGVPQKWTTTVWTQDNTSVSYQLNPRITETNINDAGNQRRTTIHYSNSQYAQYGLPSEIREYAANAGTVLRQTFTDYNLSQAYLDRRIIGLVSQVQVTNGSAPVSKTTYAYDDPARLQTLSAAATQHDTAYGGSFTTRGNLTSVSRWDVNDINNQTKKLTSFTNYFISGSPASSTDPAGHVNSMSYADGFSDNTNRNTFAYPTTMTDADNFNSSAKYNFDTGATTQTQSPPPAGQSQGAIQTMTYNNLGQLERVTTLNNGAYQRFWYGAEFAASYATVNNVADESYSVQVTDGHGRVIGALRNHPGSNLGYSLVHSVYDLMGRTWLQSNPAEVNSSWSTTGGDDAAGIYYTQQSYDWKSRPRITTHPDLSTVEVSYSGCGCAGGEVVTMRDEVGRRQKIYSDILGRQVKMEVLNWNGDVYSTRTNGYNARDQIETVKQYQGLESSGNFQQITKTYDGYGRLSSRKEPIQTTATTYTYYADSQPHTVTDARGVTQTFTYNGRKMPETVSYSGGPALATVTIGYDGAGNRTSMTDGTGSRDYFYNQLSQLTSEKRIFSGLNGNFTLSYEYNLAGALKAITDHTGSRAGYQYNEAAMLTTVNGSGAASAPTYMSNIAYRASGAIKDLDFGNGAHQHMNFDARQRNTSLSLTNGSLTATWGFEYYADGKLRKVSDSNDADFDRAFDYDHVGRLQEARTGSEARGGSTADGPFKQTYSYDVWENTTSRSYRLWNQEPQTQSVSFTNNRRQPGFYDNEGNPTADADADYSYDAAGRQNQFVANVHLGGWPTNLPEQSALEVTQTFDGNSAPAKKTIVNRWEQLIAGELQIQAETSTVYYLRSSVLGGKVVAELNETGAKKLGYVFAGSMQIATQHIFTSSSEVVWTSTSPATGSEYMMYMELGRKELDPLGAEVTSPPTPNLILEPVFYNPKFDQMPLMIEGGPSEEYERNNREWAALVSATIQAVQDRERAEDLWQAGKRSEAMAILMKNPNVGIEYRAFYKNEIIKRGSYFGQDAADFLAGINIAVGAGLLTPLTTQAAYVSVVGGDAAGMGTQKTTTTETFGEKIYTRIDDARGGSHISPCTKDILGQMGFGRFINLDAVRVHIGIPDWVTDLAQDFGGIVPKAITVGNDIYYRSVADYRPSNVAGLAEMGHELTHVLQYKVLGASFYLKYLGQWARNGFQYGEGMELEKKAAQVERNLNLSIPQRFGNDPCKKFRR